jgi:transcription elongation factor Elf1
MALIVIPAAPKAPTAALVATPDLWRAATCPLCWTSHPHLTNEALRAGAEFNCSRCGQGWDAKRLAKVTAYSDWADAQQKNPGAATIPVV